MKKLIAYYSRPGENYFGGQIRSISEGNTKKAAEMIAEVTGGDLFEIRQQHPYSADYSACIKEAQEDLNHHRRPALVKLPDSLDDYDEIWIGSPIYWGTMPMAVFTFLEAFDWKGKTIHPFCTHEGSGLGNMPSDLKKETPGSVVKKGLAIHGSAVDKARPLIENWIRED